MDEEKKQVEVTSTQVKEPSSGGSGLSDTLLLIVLVFLAVIGVMGYVFLQKNNPYHLAGVVSTTTPTEQVQIQASSTESINCGISDLYQHADCFITAAQTCTPASMNVISNLPILGTMENTKDEYFQINGQKNGSCELYYKMATDTYAFTQNYILTSKNEGETDAQISAQLATYNTLVKNLVGTDGLCEATSGQSIANLIIQRAAGTFSSDDFTPLNCTGSYFTEASKQTSSGTYTLSSSVVQSAQAPTQIAEDLFSYVLPSGWTLVSTTTDGVQAKNTTLGESFVFAHTAIPNISPTATITDVASTSDIASLLQGDTNVSINLTTFASVPAFKVTATEENQAAQAVAMTEYYILYKGYLCVFTANTLATSEANNALDLNNLLQSIILH